MLTQALHVARRLPQDDHLPIRGGQAPGQLLAGYGHPGMIAQPSAAFMVRARRRLDPESSPGRDRIRIEMLLSQEHLTVQDMPSSSELT